jgi:anti-anti-sigma factor
MQDRITRHTVTVFLRGEFDLSRGSEIADRITGAIGRAWPGEPILVDFADVTFFDCFSLGQLLHARDLATRCGVDLRVVHVDEPLTQRIMEITGTDEVLGVGPARSVGWPGSPQSAARGLRQETDALQRGSSPPGR